MFMFPYIFGIIVRKRSWHGKVLKTLEVCLTKQQKARVQPTVTPSRPEGGLTTHMLACMPARGQHTQAIPLTAHNPQTHREISFIYFSSSAWTGFPTRPRFVAPFLPTANYVVAISCEFWIDLLYSIIVPPTPLSSCASRQTKGHTEVGNKGKRLIRPEWVHADDFRPIEFNSKTHLKDEIKKKNTLNVKYWCQSLYCDHI